MRNKNKKVSLAKKPFLVLSRRAIVGWSVAIFLICAWMFAIGVLVGRGTSPLKIDISDLQKKLDAAMAELKQKKQGQARQHSASVKDNEDLQFYEALKKNREDTEEPLTIPPAPAIEEKFEPPTEDKPSPSPPPEEKPKPAKKSSMKRLTKAQNKAIEQGESAKPEPATGQSKTDPAGKPYTIQVAAFKDAGDADRLVAELKQKGFSAYRAIGKVPGSGIWYRVRIGEYHNSAEADSTMAKLRKAGKKPVLVEK